MEGRKQEGPGSDSGPVSSSSSLINELFGSKESSSSSSSSSEFFGSMFSPPFGFKAKSEVPGDTSKRHESEISQENYKDTSSIVQYQMQKRVEQPCQLSSSIYYGGQDYVYPQSPNSHQGSGINNSIALKINDDGEEDDSGSASRGNWWLGSLYY